MTWSLRNVICRSLISSRKKIKLLWTQKKKSSMNTLNRVSDIIERLEKLEDLVTTEPVTNHASGIGDDRLGVRLITESEHLSRQLDQIYDSLMKVKRVKDDKAFDVCSLEGYEERVKSIDADLQVIKRDMLLIGDYNSLAERAAVLEEASFEIRVAIKYPLKNINPSLLQVKRLD